MVLFNIYFILVFGFTKVSSRISIVSTARHDPNFLWQTDLLNPEF